MRKKKAKQQHAPMELSYEQLEAATGGFSREMLVGHGSHGKVYRGVIQLEGGGGKLQVAVKKPSSLSDRSKHKRELDVLTSVSSPYLVNLLGTAGSHGGEGKGEEKLIVLEYMPNGSLHDMLHASPTPPGWSRRLLVALQVAQGVQALHDAVPPIIHRDIKSSNVLLGSNWDAKLADFSLAVRDISCQQQQSYLEEPAAASTAPLPPPPAGTIGYLDPSYSRPAKLGPKIDIFSYGVLLLELISGRRAMDMAQETTSILAWAAPLIKNVLLLELYDPRIKLPSFNTERAIKQVVGIAARCVSSREEERPSAEDIVRELQQTIEQLRLIPPIWGHLRIDRLAKRISPYLGNWWIMRRQTRRITSTTIICTNHLYEDDDHQENSSTIQQATVSTEYTDPESTTASNCSLISVN